MSHLNVTGEPHAYVGSGERCRYCGLTTNHIVHVGAPPVILQAEVDKFVDDRGYFAGAIMPDGRVAMLVPRLFGVEIVIGAAPTEMAGVDELYTFAPARVGVVAWFNWSRAGYVGEPEGWIRHRPSNRRRFPDGDPATERIMP